MTVLELKLFGSFRVTLKGDSVTAFESDKVRALLAYLAVEAARPQRRETLVGLLWPDWPECSARASLSQALYNLRAAIGERWQRMGMPAVVPDWRLWAGSMTIESRPQWPYNAARMRPPCLN